MFSFTETEQARFLSLVEESRGRHTLIKEYIKSDNFEGLQCLREIGESLLYYIHEAMQYDKLEIVKWLVKIYDYSYPFKCGAMTTAVMYGHLEIVKFLQSKGFPLNCEVFLSAIRYSRLEILEWLVQSGCPADLPLRVAWSARRSSPEMIFFLTENGFL